LPFYPPSPTLISAEDASDLLPSGCNAVATKRPGKGRFP
jgi:hypothetical protein